MKFIKHTSLILCIVLVAACGSQQEATEKAPKKKTEEMVPTKPTPPTVVEPEPPTIALSNKVGLGIVDGLGAFMNGDTQSWFAPSFERYSPNTEVLNSLKDLQDDITIRGYMGTWCGDSKRETPRLYKILNAINYDMSKLTMVSVDRTKSKPVDLVDGYNIFRVPTFIFYRDGEEIGLSLIHI